MKNILLALCTLAVMMVNCKPRQGDDVGSTSIPADNAAATSLSGAWTVSGDPNATVLIRKDSIYYVDWGKSFRYRASTDSMTIYFDDFIYKASYRIDHDTLYFSQNGSVNIMFRWKE